MGYIKSAAAVQNTLRRKFTPFVSVLDQCHLYIISDCGMATSAPSRNQQWERRHFPQTPASASLTSQATTFEVDSFNSTGL